jgi:hypothetical protein
MKMRTCQICGYTKALEKKKCPACGWAVNTDPQEDDELRRILKWEESMIEQIRGVFPAGMAPVGAIPLEPMSLSIVVALKDSAFSDDTQRVAEALAAKTFLMLRIAKIRAGEAKANAIYDYRLQLAYGGENTILMGADKELLILMAQFTPIVLP